MPQVLSDILRTLWVEATSHPLIFLLFLVVGSWLLFQKTYVTIAVIVLLFCVYIMGDHYGFRY